MKKKARTLPTEMQSVSTCCLPTFRTSAVYVNICVQLEFWKVPTKKFWRNIHSCGLQVYTFIHAYVINGKCKTKKTCRWVFKKSFVGKYVKVGFQLTLFWSANFFPLEFFSGKVLMAVAFQKGVFWPLTFFLKLRSKTRESW